MKKGKICLSLFLIFVLANMVFAADLVVTQPSSKTLNKEYIVSGTQPGADTITLENKDNDTVTVTYSTAGDTAPWITLSENSAVIIGKNTTSLLVTYSVPDTTPALYSGEVRYGPGTEEYVTLYINIKPGEITGCRIILPFSDYAKSINREAPTLTEDFIFQISDECTTGMTINSVKTTGTFIMPNGEQPIRITGAIPTTSFDAGQQATFSLEFDVKELTAGTYTSYVQISGTSANKLYTSTLKFRITVVGIVTPITNDTWSTLPSCTLPTNILQTNITYAFTCINVDPNMEINVLPNEFLKGIKVDNLKDQNKYVWTFTPTKEGNTKLTTYFKYAGGPIGNPDIQTLTISLTPQAGLGSGMVFKFIPEIENLNDGGVLAILVKDNVSGTVLETDLYLNGVKMAANNHTFTAFSGATYVLTAAKSGFPSIEKSFTISLPQITLDFPNPVEPGQEIFFTTAPADSTITMDGTTQINFAYTFSTLGTYILTASRTGWKSVTKNITVEEKLRILTPIPEKIELNTNYIIDLSKNANWHITWKENNETAAQTLTTGELNQILFTPTEKGIYTLYIRGDEVKTWDNRGRFNLPKIDWKMAIIILIIVIVIGAVLYYLSTKQKSGGAGFSLPPSDADQNVLQVFEKG